MTYIQYATEQLEITNQYGLLKKPRNKAPDGSQKPDNDNKLPKPEFMPLKLIHSSNMKVVPGNKVEEGYCAISYSWDQCGKSEWNKITTEIKRTDERRHIIYTKNFNPEGARHADLLPKFVDFKGVIQQICKDFSINYIFYDQECITQEDTEKRRYEISQMNKVFINASFTVVLVPELCYTSSESGIPEIKMANIDAISRSSWGKCMWSLEEAFLSEKILFVGKDVHMWSSVISKEKAVRTRANPFLYTLCHKNK